MAIAGSNPMLVTPSLGLGARVWTVDVVCTAAVCVVSSSAAIARVSCSPPLLSSRSAEEDLAAWGKQSNEGLGMVPCRGHSKSQKGSTANANRRIGEKLAIRKLNSVIWNLVLSPVSFWSGSVASSPHDELVIAMKPLLS